MADLSQEQMLEMARIADEDVEHLTFRLNALLEAAPVDSPRGRTSAPIQGRDGGR